LDPASQNIYLIVRTELNYDDYKAFFEDDDDFTISSTENEKVTSEAASSGADFIIPVSDKFI
jgi:hypothetical protein